MTMRLLFPADTDEKPSREQWRPDSLARTQTNRPRIDLDTAKRGRYGRLRDRDTLTRPCSSLSPSRSDYVSPRPQGFVRG